MRTPRNTLTHLSATATEIDPGAVYVPAMCGARVAPARTFYTVTEAVTCARCLSIAVAERAGRVLRTPARAHAPANHHPRCICWECTGQPEGGTASEQPATPKPPRVVVYVEGGIVQWVLSDQPNAVRVVVLDGDCEGDCDDEMDICELGRYGKVTGGEYGTGTADQAVQVEEIYTALKAEEIRIENENEAAGVRQAERDLNGDSGGSSYEHQQAEARKLT